MILDQIKHVELYYPLGENFRKAFEFLKNSDLENIGEGKYEIDGENVFAIVQNYDTKPRTAGKWEAHKKYADIQYIVSGKEKIGFSFPAKMIVTEEYNSDKDIMFLKGEGDFLILGSGCFAIFFPTDIHMPGIAVDLSTAVKKVVIKVKVSN